MTKLTTSLQIASKKKPVICLVDEDPVVEKGWARSLGDEAILKAYKDYTHLLRDAKKNEHLVPSFNCIIMGRFFKNSTFDIVSSNFTDEIKKLGCGPIFLNWQGYITKEELNRKFDGKLFHRYGVKWQTLRLRIQKHEKVIKDRRINTSIQPSDTISHQNEIKKSLSRSQRCQELLKMMAKRAHGEHRVKIEHYLNQDKKSGVSLLEAIYHRLMTTKDASEFCPSRYIASSPVIAKRLLKEALFDF